MAKLTAFEVPPPGPGLKTVTFADPGAAMSLDEITAVSSELPLKVVGRGAPFQRTTEVNEVVAAHRQGEISASSHRRIRSDAANGRRGILRNVKRHPV